MAIGGFFLKAALYPTAIAMFLLGGKGCVMGVVPDDDQKGMTYAGRVADNVFDDCASIVQAIFENAKERTPEEIKAAGRELSNTVKEVGKDLDKRKHDRDVMEDINATINDDLTND